MCIPLSTELAIKFYKDQNTRMTTLINMRLNHDESSLRAREFSDLCEGGLREIHERMDQFLSIRHIGGYKGQLKIGKNDGKILMKGCFDDRCSGVELTGEVIDNWEKFEGAMFYASKMKLTYK